MGVGQFPILVKYRAKKVMSHEQEVAVPVDEPAQEGECAATLR